MLPQQIVYILNFFDTFGYYSESSALAKHSKLQFLVFIVQILLATDFTLYQFRLAIELCKILGPLQTFNEMLQYTVGLCTYWLIIFDSFFYRRKHRNFWKVLQQVDAYFCKQFVSFRGFLCKLVEFFLVSIILYTLTYIFNAIPQIDGVFIYLALIIICQLRIFYYIFCLEIVNWQLQMIQNEIGIMKQRSSHTVAAVSRNNSVLRTHKTNDLMHLTWANKYYGCVIEMTDLLNIIFSWSQFASILFIFYSLLTDLNWCYASFDLFPSLKYFSKYVQCQIFEVNHLILVI